MYVLCTLTYQLTEHGRVSLSECAQQERGDSRVTAAAAGEWKRRSGGRFALHVSLTWKEGGGECTLWSREDGQKEENYEMPVTGCSPTNGWPRILLLGGGITVHKGLKKFI